MSQEDTGTKRKAGRPKGTTMSDQVPPELRRMLSRLKNVSPKAIEVLIRKMITTLPDGTVVEDARIAEKLISIYFATLKASEDIKNKNAPKSETPQEQDARPVKPKFTLEVVNPTNGKKLAVSKA